MSNKRSAAVVAGLSACLAGGVVHGAEKLSVLVNWYSVETHKAAWDDLIQRFRTANPDIDLEVRVGGNEDQLRLMILSGTAPDVVHFDRYKVAEWAFNHFFVPIDQYLQGINPRNTFVNGPLQEAMFRGRLYAVPTDMDIRGLFMNVRHFDEAGLPSKEGPMTWDELNDFAVKLTKRNADGRLERMGLIPWIGNWYHHAWFWTFGGDYFDNQAFRPTLNRRENVQAFEWMATYAQRFGTESALSAQGFNWDSFANERLSMMPAHHYAAEEFTAKNRSLEFWGAPVPHAPGGRNGTWSGGLALVVPKGVKNEAGASRFLRFMASTEAQVRYYTLTRALPTTLSGLRAVTELASPLERVFMEQAAVGHWRHPFSSLIYGPLGTAQSQVVNLQKPANQALDEAQQLMLAQHSNIWGK